MGLAKLLMMQEKPQEAVKYLRMAVQSIHLTAQPITGWSQVYRRLQMTELAQKEMHLFQEIKQTKIQVEALYRQMNRLPKPQADEVPDAETHDQ